MAFNESSDCWETETSVFDAKEIYVVLQNDYRISRNIRAEWFFKNLNKNLTIKWKTSQDECSNEIEVISAIPKYRENYAVDAETGSSTVKIVPDTRMNFLSTQYRLVFCLDLSFSVATVDVQHDCIYFEEIYSALEQSLKSVCEPFYVPNSQYFFVPQIYITVIAHIPNCPTAVPQVLIQGWILTRSNVRELLDILSKKLKVMCKIVADVSASVQEEQVQFMMSHDSAGALLDGTIDGNKMIKKVLDMSADVSSLKLIRCGILALQLLPENSSAGIVVITDGIVNLPNCKALDSLLTQLRNSTIACSFLQLGSPFHPFSSFGRVPYQELMEFISTATCGAYFPASKDILIHSAANEINAYHKALLIWNFQKTTTSYFLEAYEPSPNKNDYWHVENPHFYTVAHQSRVRKKHTEGTLKVTLENLLSCRLREGYTVKNVVFDEGKNLAEVRLVLPWMMSTNIEYLITSAPGRQWMSSISEIPSCHFEVIVDGCYEFLHDVTCSDKKPIKSIYRKIVIAQFWNYSKNLSNTDQILSQLYSFSHNSVYYTIPESMKNGVPLFYFPTNSSMPVLSSKNVANMQFTSFWKPLCMLDINVWQKWMHVHRIGIILHHDMPLAKNLHLPNSSGRYVPIQCRQAIALLNSLLSEYSSFTLVENHSYIRLLFDEADRPPKSFYVIRVTSKPPCVVIRLAFLGGLPGLLRCQIVSDLREKILNLKLTKRATSKDSSQSCKQQPLSFPETSCCFFLKKPVEKVLIRYEKLPTNYLVPMPESLCNLRGVSVSPKHSDSYLYVDALITLSKYLEQQRWIWTLQYDTNTSLALASASKILYTLTNARLQEGFHFAHSSFGIIYMVQEIPMDVPKDGKFEKDSIHNSELNCCVIQYILFPPHTNTTLQDNISDEDDNELTEADGELQIITECWVEPQFGKTFLNKKSNYLNNLTYPEILSAIHKRDLEINIVLTTLEHLCSLCQKINKTSLQQSALEAPIENITVFPSLPFSVSIPTLITSQNNSRSAHTNTYSTPYCFDLMSLLPKSPQTEIIFSALHEASSDINVTDIGGNDIMFNFLAENQKYFHDQEIQLSLSDCLRFLFQIHHRRRHLVDDPDIPFPHPPFRLPHDSPELNLFINDTDCKVCGELSFCPQELLNEIEKLEVPKWRCFIKGCSPSHIILTLMPSTFKDVRKLHHQILPIDKVSNVENERDTDHYDMSVFSNTAKLASDHQKSEDIIVTEIHEPITDDKQNKLLGYHSLHIPVYVYSCSSSLIVDQLVQQKESANNKNHYEKHTFDYETLNDDFNFHPGEIVFLGKFDGNSDSSPPRYKDDSDNVVMKQHCSFLDKSFSKAFVYGVYRSLTMGYNVHNFDAVAAIDGICEESLLEIDITEFVYMICGHVKDFTTKNSVRHLHLSNEEDDPTAYDNKPDIEKTPEKCLFPLSVLQKHQPCEDLHQKHLNIKEKFSEIIENSFKMIPSRKDYFFFDLVPDDAEELSIKMDGEDSQEEDAMLESVVSFEEAGNDVDKVSNVCDEDTSLKSCLNTESSFSSIDKDTDHDSVHDKLACPPLFVHFSCSIRSSKQDIKSYPLISLPTCLSDVIQCLDANTQEINLDDLRITLDITCLTVPSDIENPEVTKQRIYTTSYSSSSPVPEAELYQKEQSSEDDKESRDSSEVPSDTLQGGSLQNLPSFQREAIYKCVEKVKWLLQDEKASVALNSYPITSEVLTMVVNHVKSSKNKQSCVIKEVPLNFVFGDENSLDKFLQAFKRMSPIGYRLNSINGTYYLVLDPESAKITRHPFGSLNPPLGIAHKFQMVRQNPHSIDGTELKKLGEDASVFADGEYSYLQSNINTDMSDDFKKSEKQDENIFNFKPRIVRAFHQTEDSDTDEIDTFRPKMKFHRKISAKRSSCTFHIERRPRTRSITWNTEKYKLSDRPHTAPPNLSTSSFKNHDKEISSRSIKQNENRKYVQCWNNEVSMQLEGTSPNALAGPKDLLSTQRLTNKRNPSDCAGSPAICSETEYGSFHFSNTEDGYDGDSSDCGSDWDWLSTVDTQRPLLPKFWLIMNVCNNRVLLYFHMRERNDIDEELSCCKEILNEVVAIIENICKEVNQVLLLQNLYETRMCNRLLVPEGSEDLWKEKDSSFLPITIGEDPDFEVQEKYLEATLKLEPGAFDCPVVWVTHFKLHHRLISCPQGNMKSYGIQALRSVLNSFSVNNRENMFVYQEESGSVFYLRLYEEICEENHSSCISKHEDNLSLMGSCCSSLQSLPQRRNYNESETETEFRPRVNSGASDGYRQDSLSTTSRRLQKCVALNVHGIGEVGTAIKNELVQVLQNRLNDGILDIIITMLARNPLCMLTPEDVQFIQNPNSAPTHEMHFTLPVKLLGYAHSVHIYLRQNLLQFLYNPKYTDNRRENHFKAYSHSPMEWSQVDDNDIFLYHLQPASGLLGGKGISCIVLSLVTGQGAPYQTINNLPPDPSAYQDALSESEFEDLTSTVLYAPKKEKCPGPVALIRFQIWSVGKDAKELIETRLASAVRHALWDILMEYHAFTCPISDTSYLDDSSCYSEPTTPIKVRRTGTAGIDTNLQSKDFHPSPNFQTSKEMSSSVPDISTKIHSPASMLKEISVFKFGNGPQSAKPEFYTETSNSMSSVSPKAAKIDKQNLNSAFHTIMKPLLHFGDKLGCPALLKHTYVLPSRHSIVYVSKEIQNIIKNVLRDIFPKVYVQASTGANGDYEYIPFSPYANTGGEIEESQPGTVKNFIIIGRNEKQWKAYIGQGDFLKFQEINNESLRTYQKYQTHICCRRSSETFTDSLPSSPTSFSKSHNSLVSSSFKSQSMAASDQTTKSSGMNFVPRQRLFLIYIDDKKITLFLYNWSQDITQTLLQQLTSLVKWHEQRNSFLNNILLQKLGLFYGLSNLSRTNADKGAKEEKVKVSREIRESIDDSLTSAFSYMELLIHSHNYTKENHSSSSSSRSSSISVKPTYVMKNLKNLKPPVPFHLSSSANIKDPVTAHGSQFLETITTQRRDMQVLNQMWKSRGSSVYYPFERVFHELKRLARLSHYCLTPLLFSPSWRWKVAPIRDHALEPLEQTMPVSEKPADSGIFSRSRHSSGSSIKNSDTSSSSGSNSASRVRRMSGAYPGSNQSSPKLRTKTPSEETWHNTVCRHYLQEYVQYLHTIGFISLRTEPSSQSKKSVGNEEDKLYRSDSFSIHKHNIRGQQVFYLIKSLLGGLLVFEIGLADPYAYGHLYSIECSRFNNSCNLRTLNSQFAAAFLDELDKVKLLMHLHSFTYDYHLRTIHSYISGRQLIFRHGYHLTSFLDDFIKYYQKVPTGARNLLYAGTLTIPDINMSGSHLYNYIISHNMLYGMTVLRMVPVMVDSSSNIDTEFALIELSAQKASYKDFNDICQMGNFDVGLLINHNTLDPTADPNSLVLNYYIILTSQRDLYPKLPNFGATLGSFQTVRFGSMQSFNQYSSRKTGHGSMMTEKEKFESSGEESVNSNDSRSKKSVIRGMCDEDVTYLGYYSSQETMMQQVLSQRAEAAQTHLKGVVHRASIHCRRDSLWSSLLPRSLKDDNSSKDYSSLSTSSYADFAELLDLVTVMPLNDFDEKLSPFMNMHISWYVTLAPVLKMKYLDTHREYVSPDGNSVYVVVTDAQCPDTFLLLTIDAHTNRTELGLVFREFSADVDHNDDKPNQRTDALHSLVEGFVNACSFHLWTCML